MEKGGREYKCGGEILTGLHLEIISGPEMDPTFGFHMRVIREKETREGDEIVKKKVKLLLSSVELVDHLSIPFCRSFFASSLSPLPFNSKHNLVFKINL